MKPLGFAARIGGVLAAPRRTLARLAGGEARPGDIAWLLLVRLVAGELDRLVRAALLARDSGLGDGVQYALSTVTAVLPDLVGILLAGLLLGLFVSRGTRGHGRAFDLAAYAWVPYLAVTLARALYYTARGAPPSDEAELAFDVVGVGWSALVWALALAAARAPDDAAAPADAPPSAAAPPRGRVTPSRAAGLALLGALALLGGLRAVYVARNWTAVSRVTVPRGAAAPDVTLPTLAGDRFHLGDERGHPVALVFWASWCPPCRAELPGVVRVAAALARAPHTARIIAVNTEQNRAEAAKAARELGLTMPVALDDGSASAAYHVMTIPQTVLIDADGKVHAVLRGAESEADLMRAITALER